MEILNHFQSTVIISSLPCLLLYALAYLAYLCQEIHFIINKKLSDSFPLVYHMLSTSEKAVVTLWKIGEYVLILLKTFINSSCNVFKNSNY